MNRNFHYGFLRAHFCAQYPRHWCERRAKSGMKKETADVAFRQS